MTSEDLKIEQAFCKLRGHKIGVTALCGVSIDSNDFILSGDESGTVILWDLSTLKCARTFENLVRSRIQSMRVLKFVTVDDHVMILVVQSRDNGVSLYKFDKGIEREESDLELVVCYDSHDALFSRGDAIICDNESAILAYPSALDSHLVTVRLVKQSCKTLLSGVAAARDPRTDDKKVTVFDIKLRRKSESDKLIHLFVAYENGCLCMYEMDLDSIKTDSALDIKSLNVSLVKLYDTGSKDFISTFDVKGRCEGYDIIIGYPSNKLMHISTNQGQVSEIDLKCKGTSCSLISPFSNVVAVACWNGTLKLYDYEDKRLIHKIVDMHKKQVQDMMIVRAPEVHLNALTDDCDTRTFWMCCASNEGTISISSIYY